MPPGCACRIAAYASRASSTVREFKILFRFGRMLSASTAPRQALASGANSIIIPRFVLDRTHRRVL